MTTRARVGEGPVGVQARGLAWMARVVGEGPVGVQARGLAWMARVGEGPVGVQATAWRGQLGAAKDQADSPTMLQPMIHYDQGVPERAGRSR